MNTKIWYGVLCGILVMCVGLGIVYANAEGGQTNGAGSVSYIGNGFAKLAGTGSVDINATSGGSLLVVKGHASVNATGGKCIATEKNRCIETGEYTLCENFTTAVCRNFTTAHIVGKNTKVFVKGNGTLSAEGTGKILVGTIVKKDVRGGVGSVSYEGKGFVKIAGNGSIDISSVTNATRVLIVGGEVQTSMKCKETGKGHGKATFCSGVGNIHVSGKNIKVLGVGKGTLSAKGTGKITVVAISIWEKHKEPNVTALQPVLKLNKTASNYSLHVGGGSVTYYYNATNTGNASLINISISDDKCSPVHCPKNNLTAGESMICNCTVTINQTTTNIATATGNYSGTIVNASANATVIVAALQPVLKLNKTASNYSLQVGGGNVTYTYVVNNIGNVNLTNITVSDDKCSTINCSGITTLAIGQNITCNCTMFINETTTNIATATGNYSGTIVNASANATVIVTALQPGIKLNKTASNYSLHVGGGNVTYYYNVTNTGNLNLANINVSDDKCSPVSCPKNTLTLGESMICTCVANLTQNTMNIANVTGTAPNGQVVSDSDNKTVIVEERNRSAMRTIGFWKHQFAVATGNNNGQAQIDSATLQSYLPTDVFGTKIETLQKGYDVLWLKKATMEERAIQQCFATLLNFENGAASNDTLVDTNYDKKPDMKFSDAITAATSKFNGGNYENAKNICDSINNMDE